eukprot:2557358-Amphidinium_carterae.1
MSASSFSSLVHRHVHDRRLLRLLRTKVRKRTSLCHVQVPLRLAGEGLFERAGALCPVSLDKRDARPAPESLAKLFERVSAPGCSVRRAHTPTKTPRPKKRPSRLLERISTLGLLILMTTVTSSSLSKSSCLPDCASAAKQRAIPTSC